MNVSERIKTLRQQKGITVNKLANMAGISQSYLRDLELGIKQPTVEYLSYICDALNISLMAFFDDDKSDEIKGELQKLDKKQQQALLDFIKTLTD